MPPDTRASLEQLEKAHAELCAAVGRQWDGKPAFKLSIPARPEYDTDCIIGEALRSAIALLSDVVRAQEPTPTIAGGNWCPHCGLVGEHRADCEYEKFTKPAVVRAQSQEEGWQPIDTAPKDRIALHEQRAVGGWKHKAYGWIWGPLDYHPDKHHERGGYFIANGGEPTHWMKLPLPSITPDQGEGEK